MNYAKNICSQILVLFIWGVISLGGQSSTAFANDVIRINGSGSALVMLKPLIRGYVKMHPDVRIEMEKPLGSSGAIKALISGALDIAVVSKKLSDNEMKQGAKAQDFGSTPLAIVTAKDVPLKNIKTNELESIYSGQMRKWPNGENIRLVLRPQEDIDVKILRGLSPKMDDAITRSYSYPGMLLAITDPESNTTVSKTAGSIGASGLCGIIGEKLPLNILSLNGVMPSVDTLAKGRYPLAKEIRFVTTDKLSKAAKKFLQFVYSQKGRNIARDKGVLVTVNN